jgi:porin
LVTVIVSAPALAAQEADTTQAQARDTVRARPSLAGPNQVDNQIDEDAFLKHPLFDFAFLGPYLAFKERLKENSGFSFGLDYTSLYFGSTQSAGEDAAGSGNLRLFGSWALVGRESDNTGAIVYKVEHRHAYTEVPVSGLGFELGYVGLLGAPFNDAGFLLTNLYWKQGLANGRLVLVGGWVDATDYLDVYGLVSPWLHFSNFVFSTGSATIPAPNQGLGLAAGVWASDHVYVLGGFADTNSDPSRPGDGFESFFDVHEYFKHIEVGWTTGPDRAYLDNIHVTYWHADERVAAGEPSGWGLNMSAALYLDDHWLPFLRGGYAEDGGSLLQKSVSAGVGYQGVPGGHVAGLGANWGQPNEVTFSPDLRDQYSFELFLRIQLANQVAITPDVQLLVNPALNPDVSSLWVFGVRGRMAL